MKTLDQILQYKSGPNCSVVDGRDITRLGCFIPVEHWPAFGLGPREGVDPSTIVAEELTRENMLKHLESDLAFAFDKALSKRGISASLMQDVIKMWMWVLDDELADHDEYAMYGLPLLKKVAVKYGFPNPIGDDYGNESHYDEQGLW